MKQLFSIINILTFTAFALTSCSGQDKANAAVVNQTSTQQYQYAHFNEIIFSQEGEFLGLNLLDERTLVKTKLPSDAFVDESEDFLYYQWTINNNIYKVDLFFNKENKLKSIDAYISFYKEDKEKDRATAEVFYADMEKFFIEKYGKDNLETNEVTINQNDLKYNSWYFDEKDVEVGLDDVEVYWYMSAYENLFEEEIVTE